MYKNIIKDIKIIDTKIMIEDSHRHPSIDDNNNNNNNNKRK